ncbi:ABC transporter permease [Salinibacterium sp. ZJ454]|uniref:ABC transporter permease n=1 Tax=Salinibacterium sp. ZJ454 TaxID=2708339 RepID=UPI001AB06294|nr:ABC transporter permease [Salinibacterium sp. ZJ454]
MSTLTATRQAASWRAAPIGVVAAAVFLVLLIAAAVAPSLFTMYDPIRADVANSLQAPSTEHWFGTDQAGRDVFARVVYGARYSLLVGFGATLIALVCGLIIGVLSGMAPRAVDTVLSRIIEIVMAFPEFLLALVVIAVVGPGETSLLIAVSIAAIPAYARIARGQTMVVRRTGYVRAAIALGVTPWRTTLRHIMPNTLGPLLVMATIGVGTAIVSAAGLSFLGMGPKPPTPEWGLILSDGRNFLATAWWIAVFPGLAITATVIATSTVGRYLRQRGTS